MTHMNALKKILGTISTGVTLTLVSTSVLAHTGHSHAQHDTLSGVLHSLTTHPLLFGVVGLALVTAVYMSRN